MTPAPYDALLLVSFGGPEGEADVIPFLENVLRGKNVPRERMLEVAEHYFRFGGKSPINEQNRALIAALQRQLDLPIYWGNRNWHPMLADALRQMRADGVRRALAFVTSAFGSYSGCRQYREDIERARAEAGPCTPEIDKLPTFHNRPGFIQAVADRARAAFDSIPPGRRAAARLIFTAHSIPVSMAETSPYIAQLRESCALVGQRLGRAWELAYQSRSGPPSQPWLEPDICERLRALHAEGATGVVVSPIGFVSDHLEVIYDLDTQAAGLCRELGLAFHRAGTPGVHPAFVAMIRDLAAEKMSATATPECPADCCPGILRAR